MKSLLAITTIFLFAITSINAQAVAGLFQEKSTETQYKLQQIAALKIYIGYAKKGYDIVSKGINTVRNIKKGDFNLHRDFFSSLKNVNPRISNYVKVADIIAYQVRIIKTTKQALQGIRETKQFTKEELDYCKQVFDNLLDECAKIIDELLIVITSGEAEMKDNERIKRIDNIYTDIQDKYSFCSSFSDEAGVLSVQRLGEQMEINRSRIINGLK